MKRIILAAFFIFIPSMVMAQQQVCVTIPVEAVTYFSDAATRYNFETTQTYTDEEFVFEVLKREISTLLARKERDTKESEKNDAIQNLMDSINTAMP